MPEAPLVPGLAENGLWPFGGLGSLPGAGRVGCLGVVGGMQAHQRRQYNPFSMDWLGGACSESRTVSFQAGIGYRVEPHEPKLWAGLGF